MRNKILKFKREYSDYNTLSVNKIDEGDYISALNILKSFKGFNPLKFDKLGEIYFEMALYTISLKYYFKFLEVCDEFEIKDTYGMISSCYAALGNNDIAEYYFNVMLTFSSDEDKEEISKLSGMLKDFEDTDDSDDIKSKYKIVYPPEKVDYSEQIYIAKQMIFKRDYDGAMLILNKIDKNSNWFAQVLNSKSLIHLMKDDLDSAEKFSREAVELEPKNVTALTTLSSILLQKNDKEGSLKVVEALMLVNSDELEDNFKIASVLCEHNILDKALDKYLALEILAPYDKDILFAIAAINAKNKNYFLAKTYLLKIISIYDDTISKIYLQDLNNFLKSANINKEFDMPYICILSFERQKALMEKIGELYKLTKKEIIKKDFDDYKLALDWCIQNQNLANDAVQGIALKGLFCYNNDKSEDYVLDMLINPLINDNLKLYIIKCLTLNNIDSEFNIVFSNILRRVVIYEVSLATKSYDKFINAYSLCCSKFLIVDERYAQKIKIATEKLNSIFEINKLLNNKIDIPSLAGAIYLTTNINDIGRSVKKTAEFFGGKKEIIKEYLSLNKEKK